ncbi:alpha,alpha-trehalase ath1 [Lithohypha guttulata]|uniref:alpha,alpha-trehalase ath1 n=1 Tax=Lithohypha guttulata TaxID=1690604 RepID=UPI002DDE9532|nr:alpha,alpha-trehalase ath1 [Lithohypha guttulata]
MHSSTLTGAFLALPALLANITTASPIASRQNSPQSASIYETRFPNVTWNNDAWTLTTTTLDQGHYQSRISLGNGYIGINLAALGPFFEYDQPVNGDVLNGWPLFDRRQTFATVGGFWDSQPTTNGSNFPWLYQYGWDTAISGLPHWAGIVVEAGDAVLHASTNAGQISNFSSYIDMKHSVMNWAYTWSPSPGNAFHVSYQMFLHKVDVNQAYVTMNVTARSDSTINLVNVLDGDCALRTNPVEKGHDGDFLFSAVSPYGVPDVTAYVFTNMAVQGGTPVALVSASDAGYNASYIGRNISSIAAAQEVHIRAGETITATKYVGIASTDAFANPRRTAQDAARAAVDIGYSAALESHMSEWETLFPSTSVDNFAFPENGSLPEDAFVVEAQIMAVVNPFQLLQQTISESAQDRVGNATINSHSISVGGMGSDSYAGQIFWDAEVWMQPGLAATFPYAARGILNYRVERYPQAQENLQTNYQSSKNNTSFSPEGAIFPWTSGRTGNCTATGPCWDYEYHLNGDIGLSFINYWLASGDTEFFETELLPVYDSIAITLSELLERNGTQWMLRNMTDPDEFANHIDNGGFTMPLIGDTLDNVNAFREYFNQTVNTTWYDQAENVIISKNPNANIILEFTGMNASINVKQADVVLVTYPLSYDGQDYDTEDSLDDLNWYANKQSQDGPAMTYSVFAIVANEASPSGCSAYTYQQYSTFPYVRAPWFQFSEQLIDNYEENGNFHPAYPFLTGHGGADQVVLFGYLGFRFVPDWVLHIDPNLPPQIPQITYRTFYWQGWPISAYSNQTHTTLSRTFSGPLASGAVPNSTFESAPIPVALGPVNGEQIDGASSTKWQPAHANETAQLTIELETGHRVLGFGFEWGDAPAYNYTLWFHNDSSMSSDFGIATAQNIVQGATVQISEPFEPQNVAVIAPIGQNTSELWLNGTQIFTTGDLLFSGELWTSRYITLQMWGSLYNSSYTAQNMSGEGATLAEFKVIVDDLDT